MTDFVDHLQFLPVPSRGGKREPDGEHRPGGLGTRTLADRLADLGWVARLEDFAYEKPMPEKRLVEAYARGVMDGVLSAWDRSRFPILLSLPNYGGVGVVDGLGAGTGLLWISPESGYAKRGLFRRSALDGCALAMITGAAPRDRLAIEPQRLSGENVVHVGGSRMRPNERARLEADGVRVVGPDALDEVASAVGAADVDAWYVHLDVRALSRDDAPAADDGADGGLDTDALLSSLEAAVGDVPLRCVGFTRYDLNRDADGRTAATLVTAIDRLVRVAGGVPDPRKRAEAQRS